MQVQILDKAGREPPPPGINANYAPTLGIKPGDPVTFKVRSFQTEAATQPWEGEIWNFGDGTPPRRVKSDGNLRAHAPDGYAETVHRFDKPGVFLVSVERADPAKPRSVTRLKVVVE